MYTVDISQPEQPYFLANFAITLDGKVAGTRSPYWPIASRLDFEVVEELRAQVDVLIHGKNTALEHEHARFLAEPRFLELRKQYGGSAPPAYLVVSAHPDDELFAHLAKSQGTRTILVTVDEADIPPDRGVEVWRCGTKAVDINVLAAELQNQGLSSCLVEGGPTLFGSFLAANRIDELLLTLSPKLIGSGGTMLSLVEGLEFLPKEVKTLELLEVHQEGSELFLRYSFKRS